MTFVNSCYCKCGICKVNLGTKIEEVDEQLTRTVEDLGFTDIEFFNVSRGCLSTPFESNIGVSKPRYNIYKLFCKSCHEPFYFMIFDNKPIAIVKKGSYSMQRRISVDDECTSRNNPNHDMIRDLIKIKGRPTSPVMLPEKTHENVLTNENIELAEISFFQDQEIIHDFLFGSYENHEYSNTEQFVIA